MMRLYQQWLDAKAAEKAAMDDRRTIEDQLVKALSIPKNLDGTQNVQDDG